MKRKLFCEISPFTYRLSTEKEILKRHLKDLFQKTLFAKDRSTTALPELVYQHNSLIRRRLGNVNMQLQENKATNLALAVKHIDGLLIRPGETFSIWKCIGRTTKQKGYKEGLTIAKGQPAQGIGGGMCQLSNLIHWMVLHSELTITEHHHHDGLDLFPDFGRQIPFGTGTSISYNYLDYRVRNDSDNTYQSGFGWMTNICAANSVRQNPNPTPSISISRMNASPVKTGSSIATARSIGTSSIPPRAAASTANSSAPTMPK